MANVITSFRIMCSIAILFVSPLTMLFYVLYSLCGFTDMIDGTIARKTNSASEFGEKLDTIADLFFVLVCLIKLLPVINVPIWGWLWVGFIGLIKGINILIGLKIQKSFVAVHSLMNKITGGILFIIPFTLESIPFYYSLVVGCSVATLAAVSEGIEIRKRGK